jgi:hypothetical protein
MPPAIFVSNEALDLLAPPPAAAGGDYYAVAYTRTPVEGGGPPFWLEDRLRVTDDYRVAYVWAIVLAGVADDGLNAEPWARIAAFEGDPFEADDDALGRVVLYLSPLLDEVAPGDEGFDELDATAGRWDVVVRALGIGEGEGEWEDGS